MPPSSRVFGVDPVTCSLFLGALENLRSSMDAHALSVGRMRGNLGSKDYVLHQKKVAGYRRNRKDSATDSSTSGKARERPDRLGDSRGETVALVSSRRASQVIDSPGAEIPPLFWPSAVQWSGDVNGQAFLPSPRYSIFFHNSDIGVSPVGNRYTAWVDVNASQLLWQQSSLP